jgi:hypothetical protein
MPIGFCHYRYGLVLQPARFRPGAPADFVRQMGEAARERFGDLQTESEVGPAPPEVRALADRFLAALALQDEQALDRFVELSDESRPHLNPRMRRARRAFLFGEGPATLALLRRNPDAVQRAFFRARLPRATYATSAYRGWHACYCRTADCTGRWPISEIDAAVHESRPYLCIGLYNAHDSRLAPDRIVISRDAPYPIEPPASAFRRPPESSRR